MRFATIRPAETELNVVDADRPQDLYPLLGFDTNIDHGVLVPPNRLPSGVGVSIVVDGFSMFKPVAEQRYFSLGHSLFAGNALLYGFTESGDTVDLQEIPTPIFMSRAGVEEAIAAGQIDRPEMKVNGEVVWSWPSPNPWLKQ